MANEKSAESIAVAQQNEANLVNQYGQGMQDYINDQRTNGAVNTNASTLRGVWVDPQDISRTQQGYGTTAFVNQYQDPLLATVNPAGVYAATNIRNIDLPSPKKAMDMKLQGLEQKLAKANSIAELNQIGIMNQPKAMGVLTGEAAYRDKLDTARLNAFNSLYQARLSQEQRKEEKRQRFIENYGADPSMRPKGMSTREFAAALSSGKFSNLLTTAEKNRRAQLSKSSGLSGDTKMLSDIDRVWNANMKKYGGNINQVWEATSNELGSKYSMISGSEADNELRRRAGLNPIQTRVSAAVSKEELNRKINEQISTISDWNSRTDNEKALLIRSMQGDPKDFGIQETSYSGNENGYDGTSSATSPVTDEFKWYKPWTWW